MNDASDADRGLTDRVLKSYSSIDDPRLRSLVFALIRHLHAYVGETKLTDREWEFAWNFMGRMAAVPDRNEFLLAGDVLGVSQLIETLNHDRPGQSVGFALVGPFLRADAPFRKRGDSIASDGTPGARVRVSGKVFDAENGQPLAAAVLDVWQAATNGLYENQDDSQLDYNLRGRFKTDQDGSYEFVALLPTAYPVPTDGPVGELLRVAKRWSYRPAHIHVIASFPDHETLVTQIFKKGDDQTADDVVFTASENMLGDFTPDGDQFRLKYDFPLKPGISMLPQAPIPAQAV
jgi:catechol 1,2-dioxygenase